MKIALVNPTDRAGLAICRSLGQAGHQMKHLRFGVRPTIADQSRYCIRHVSIGNPSIDLDKSAARLVSELTDVNYVMPITDGAVELLYHVKNVIEPRILGPDYEALQRAKNKYAAIALTAPWIKAPPTRLLERHSDASDVSYPCFAKPIFSSHVFDGKLIGTSVSLIRSAEQLEHKRRDTPVPILVQAPISGPGIGINFVSFQGRLLGVSVTERLHEPGYGGGSSYRRSGKVTDGIVEIAKGVSAALCWTGMMMIECKLHGTELYLMELNPRPWGSINLSIFAGVDYPNLLVNAFEGKFNDLVIAREGIYARHLKKDVGWAIRHPGRIPEWLASFRRFVAGRERYDVERLNDLKPGLYQAVDTVLDLVPKLMNRMPQQAEKAAFDATKDVLFICKGNINRSVIAERTAVKLGVKARSASLLDRPLRRASAQAETYLGEPLAHRSTVLENAYSEGMNVVVFEKRHIGMVRKRAPGSKVYLLSELAGETGDIADPDGKSPEEYRACFDIVSGFVESAFGKTDNKVR